MRLGNPAGNPAADAITTRNAARWQGRRIGLLGGSFNPAHAGHLHISQAAIRALGLDAVWWLVSPQNPLKTALGIAPLAVRMAAARGVAADARIFPSDLEALLGTRYTVETLAALRSLHPAVHFIWLMGSDNLQQFHRWRDWQTIAGIVPIAVMARPGYHTTRWRSPALARLRGHVRPASAARSWGQWTLPALVLLNQPQHPASATRIRRVRPDWMRQYASIVSRAGKKDDRLPVRPAAAGGHADTSDPPHSSSSTGVDADITALHAFILKSLDDDKGEDILSIPLAGKTSIADYMVIASGRSSRQVAAMADHLIEKLKSDFGRRVKVEGLPQADWVLLDAGDIIVHMFRPEVRSFYNLEKMWSIEVSEDAAAT